MPRGTHHDLIGILLDTGIYPTLRVSGGGEWRLDMSGRHRRLFGQRVRVIGKRSEFDMIDVERIEPA